MALIYTPYLLLIDEASNREDPLSRKNLYTYLSMLENTSTLMLTHRVDEAEKICEKIILSKFNFKFIHGVNIQTTQQLIGYT